MSTVFEANKKLQTCINKLCKLQQDATNAQRIIANQKSTSLYLQLEKRKITQAKYKKEMSALQKNLRISLKSIELAKCELDNCKSDVNNFLEHLTLEVESTCRNNKCKQKIKSLQSNIKTNLTPKKYIAIKNELL
jgi:hypothetical protein